MLQSTFVVAAVPRLRTALIVIGLAVLAVLAVPSLRGVDPAESERTPSAYRLPTEETVHESGDSRALPVPGAIDRPSIRDVELALEAALREQRAADEAVRRAEAAMLDVEEQLDLRVEQGESPEELEAIASGMLEGAFAALQDALRRLDQADASVEMLEEELNAVRSD